MKTFDELFVEFNCTTFESLLTTIRNEIKQYKEKLDNAPHNDYFYFRLEYLEELEYYISYLVETNAENDRELY